MSKSFQDNTDKSRILGLDGLRAIAVVLVLIMHKTSFGAATHIGFFGVWLFFILSGYLIVGQLYIARERVERDLSTASQELMLFWYRRAFRIFPAYYAVLFAISTYYLLSDRELHGIGFYLLHLSNFYLGANMEQFATTWAHFWSLAVEEQFYVFFAPLMLFVRARYAIAICTFVLVVSVIYRTCLIANGVGGFEIYINSFVNFGLLSSGGLLYLVSARIRPLMERTGFCTGAAGIAFLITLLGMAATATPLVGDLPILREATYVLGGIVAWLVVANVTIGQSTRFVAILEWSPLVKIGHLSYSIYLLNDYVPYDLPQKLLRKTFYGADIVFNAATKSYVSPSAIVTSSGVLVCWIIVIGLAVVLRRFIELPALTIRDRATRAMRERRAISHQAVSLPKTVANVCVDK